MEEKRKSAPEFMKMVDQISGQNPLQSKKIRSFISRQDKDYWEYAEAICRKLGQSFLKTEEGRVAAARAYNRMTTDFLLEQIRFRKTGVYLLNDACVARQTVYDQPEVMRYYMVGLFLSYLLWPNHFKMLNFFKTYIQKIPIVQRYLDIATGHGLFAVETLQQFPGLRAVLLDISQTSIQVTREILETFQIGPSRFDFINGDFLKVSVDGGNFDFITMGEVLEHVNDALGFLQRACNLIKDDGRIFMTTCTNSPAIDHIYHFHNTNEIRDLIHRAGLRILTELSLPAEDIPEEQCEKELVTINYCAILMKGR